MMRAARLVFVKEIREMCRDTRLAIAICVSITILAAAAITQLRHYQRVVVEKSHAARIERERWLNLRDYGPHGAAHHGIYAFKPDSLLSAFDPGVEPYLGASVWLEAHKQNPSIYRPMQDAAAQRFGNMTAAIALQILGPLLIILLGFNAFAGERDQGTLRQLLSLGVAGRSLLLGKVGAVVAVILIFIAPALITSAIAWFDVGVSIDWSRSILLTIAYLVYLATFLGLTLAVSAFAKTARVAMSILLGLWIFNCFLVPRSVSEIAALAHPLPANVEWEAAMQADLRDGHALATEQRIKRELQKQYDVDRQDDLPINWRGVMLQRGEEQNYEAFDAHFGRLFDSVRRQDTLYQWGGLLAPVLALQTLSMGLAESDSEHHWRFIRAAEEHRRLIQHTLNAELTLHPEKEWGEFKASPDLWARVSEFRYCSPALGDIAHHYVPAFVALAFWLAVAWSAALSAANNLRP